MPFNQPGMDIESLIQQMGLTPAQADMIRNKAALGGGVPASAPPLGGAGTMEDPLQLSTMQIQGQLPPEQMGPPQPPQAGAGGPAPSIYEGMSEEQLQQMAGMGDLDRQMALAEKMRDTAPLEGRYVNQGRSYVGDSPLAHAVRGYEKYKGRKDAERIGGEQTAGRKTFIDLLRDRARRGREEPMAGGNYDPTRTRGMA